MCQCAKAACGSSSALWFHRKRKYTYCFGCHCTLNHACIHIFIIYLHYLISRFYAISFFLQYICVYVHVCKSYRNRLASCSLCILARCSTVSALTSAYVIFGAPLVALYFAHTQIDLYKKYTYVFVTFVCGIQLQYPLTSNCNVATTYHITHWFDTHINHVITEVFLNSRHTIL